MAIITCVMWPTLYLLAIRFVVRERKRAAAVLCLICALSIEFWFTQDFYRVIYAKLVASCPVS